MSYVREWAKEEINIIRHLGDSTRSKDEILNLFPNRTWTQILAKARKIGVEVKYERLKKRWTKKELRILARKYNTCSMKKMQKLLPDKTIDSIRSMYYLKFKHRSP